jgi:hypothetical protein
MRLPYGRAMMRDRCQAIPMAIFGLCALAVVLIMMLAVAVSISDFDLRQSLPSLGSFGPAAIVVLWFLASLVGVVPTSPLLLAAGATEGVVLRTL